MAEPETVDEPQTTQNGNSNNKKKRKEHSDDTLAAAYTSVKAFEDIPSTNRPGTPHRYFEASYRAEFADDIISKQEHKLSQVIHCHANGLAIVTIGDTLRDKTIQSIEFCIDESPTCNAAEKRKRQAKMLKGKTNIEGVVTPSTVIAKLTVLSDSSDTSKSSQVIPVYAGVWGAVLELNKTVSVDTLRNDPLLDGYLAVILPSGPFPPPSLRPSKIQKE